nr:uncharacterized protein LOC112727111 [Arachis hypogaea]
MAPSHDGFFGTQQSIHGLGGQLEFRPATSFGYSLQMLVHRYLLNDQSPYENDSSHPSLNSSTTKEAILQQVRFSLPYSVILLNSSNEVVQSVAFESERAKTCLNSSISRSKREDKLADAIKNTRFSPLLSVPSYK